MIDYALRNIRNAMRVLACAPGFWVACGGGLLLALGFSRALAAMLYGVSPWDPATLAAVIATVVAVAATAAFVPAWRASRVDPMTVLRE